MHLAAVPDRNGSRFTKLTLSFAWKFLLQAIALMVKYGVPVAEFSGMKSALVEPASGSVPIPAPDTIKLVASVKVSVQFSSMDPRLCATRLPDAGLVEQPHARYGQSGPAVTTLASSSTLDTRVFVVA